MSNMPLRLPTIIWIHFKVWLATKWRLRGVPKVRKCRSCGHRHRFGPCNCGCGLRNDNLSDRQRKQIVDELNSLIEAAKKL